MRLHTASLAILVFTFTPPPRFTPTAQADPYLAFQKMAADKDPAERIRAIRMVADYRSRESIRAVAGLLGDPHPRVHKEAIRALSGVVDPETILLIGKLAAQGSTDLQQAGAAEALGATRAAAAREPLLAALRDGSPVVRAAAVDALRALADPSAADAVAERLKDSAWAVRAAAVDALAELDAARAGDRLAPFLEDRDWQVRVAAVERIPRAVPDRAGDVLKKAVADPAWQVRAAAIETMEALRRPAFVPLMIERLPLEKGRLRGDLLRTLRALTGKEIGLDVDAWKIWWDNHGGTFACPAPSKDGVSPLPPTAAAFCKLPIYSRRLAFVLDLSGSMRDAADSRRDGDGPRKVDVVKAELLQAVRSFTSETHFNVILLGCDAESRFDVKERIWMPRLTPASAAAQAHAEKFVNRQLARGYTNIYDAVALAFDDPEVDTIFLLSDGGASKGIFVARQDIVEELMEKNRYRKISVHTVQAGANRDSDRWLMTELAARTGGMTVKK